MGRRLLTTSCQAWAEGCLPCLPEVMLMLPFSMQYKALFCFITTSISCCWGLCHTWPPHRKLHTPNARAIALMQGYQALGGMGRGDAQQLFARLQMAAHLFAPVWSVADRDRDGVLSMQVGNIAKEVPVDASADCWHCRLLPSSWVDLGLWPVMTASLIVIPRMILTQKRHSQPKIRKLAHRSFCKSQSLCCRSFASSCTSCAW